uniref:Uncharacterized protein n=1 Tax=Panagrolaimus sp. JU765 TaxID=591449 RepID=A0AC34Q6X8_9BILA
MFRQLAVLALVFVCVSAYEKAAGDDIPDYPGNSFLTPYFQRAQKEIRECCEKDAPSAVPLCRYNFTVAEIDNVEELLKIVKPEELNPYKACYYNKRDMRDCCMVGAHLNRECAERCDGNKPLNIDRNLKCDFGVSGLCGLFSRLNQPLV